MWIRLPSVSQPLSSDLTPEGVYRERRQLIKAAGFMGAAALLSLPALARAVSLYLPASERQSVPPFLRKAILDRRPGHAIEGETLTPFDVVSSYNNFYEFGLGKDDPARLAGSLRTEPWSVVIEGECGRPGRYTLEDILAPHALEDRIYRFRCVEAWSMVVPWLGFPLAGLIRRFEPTSRARFVEFTTLHDAQQMPGQRSGSLPWPYVEGLRMDEAMHPLTLMAVGVYGRSLPPQNGAPLRLIVPWKYGFKSIKSVVRIRFLEQRPRTTWSLMAPSEYGFYANVNPAVDHPRWTQARERRLPATLFNPNWRPTLPFNGYAADVAYLYKGMDLRRHF